jgi:broad specificity phosphatase PhoE
MKVFLIRHGETTGDIEDRYGGDYDDNLTEKGKKEAEELGNELKGKGIQAIFHSPRFRAKEAAEIVNKILNVKIKEINNLRERNAYGILSGMVKADATEKHPEEVAKLKKSKVHHDVKNSEHYDIFKKRVQSAIDEVLNHEQFETIAIISHGGFISTFVREILKKGEFQHLGDYGYLEIEMGNELKLLNLKNAELKK